MAEYTMDYLVALAPEWKRVFGEDMAMGFEIQPAQVPKLRQCLREKSRVLLKVYIATLSDKVY